MAMTKQAQINGTWYHILPDNKSTPVYKYKAKEAEITPENGVKWGARNGEYATAIDTGNVFCWDEEDQKWNAL